MEELTHIYDFGTSSYTTIKVRDVRRGRPLSKRPIALIARNKADVVECMEYERPAAYLYAAVRVATVARRNHPTNHIEISR